MISHFSFVVGQADENRTFIRVGGRWCRVCLVLRIMHQRPCKAFQNRGRMEKVTARGMEVYSIGTSWAKDLSKGI